ncbi:MAG: hypothetical protein C5B58_06185 [Acidobacteria bacterium]|nr:MAG: hypothetical protein C5B58_06185 [Acidobacteriota bacterium]
MYAHDVLSIARDWYQKSDDETRGGFTQFDLVPTSLNSLEYRTGMGVLMLEHICQYLHHATGTAIEGDVTKVRLSEAPGGSRLPRRVSTTRRSGEGLAALACAQRLGVLQLSGRAAAVSRVLARLSTPHTAIHCAALSPLRVFAPTPTRQVRAPLLPAEIVDSFGVADVGSSRAAGGRVMAKKKRPHPIQKSIAGLGSIEGDLKRVRAQLRKFLATGGHGSKQPSRMRRSKQPSKMARIRISRTK